MIDFRNEGSGLNTAALWDTASLERKLASGPMVGRFFLETKLDGERATLQMGPSGCFLISRSRHGKTKGVDATKLEKFVDKGAEDWMKRLSAKLTDDVLLDGEFVVAEESGISTSSAVARLDTVKKYVAFDILRLAEDRLDLLPLDDRREILNTWMAAYASERMEVGARMGMVSYMVYENFTEATLKSCLDDIRASTTGLEGFVLKPADMAYPWGPNYGWKIKPVDNEDGFVVGFNREKLHHMGKVTVTERVGSVEIAQWRKGAKEDEASYAVTVAFVGIPEADRCHMSEFEAKLEGRVLEFEHRGWDGKSRFRFPGFVRWRTDKGADMCMLKVRK